jgi:ribonuclease BN (tRNA processing enzyme)
MGMGKVEIQCLGSGDAFGSGGRFQACFYIQSEKLRFLIDCGASSLIAMKRFGVDPSGVDLILLSHLHGDHFGGVSFLILDGQFRRRARPLTVAGPPGLEARIHEAMEVFFPGSSRVQQKFAIKFMELKERSRITIGPLKVTPYSVVHPSGYTPYALRIEFEDKVIGYSGDTEWTEALVEAAQGADLFICEAYYFEKKVKYHLDYQTLMDQRKKLECRRLILTHMSEDLLQKVQGLEVEWAEDGKSIVV